jgi:hypothetical protein
MLTNPQTEPTKALAVPEPTAPAQPTRALTPSERWEHQPMSEQVRVAEFLAGSDIVPDAFRKRPANVWLALDMGAHMGLKPFQTFRAVHVIKGTPTFSAEAMRGMAMAAGHTVTVTSTPTEATVSIKRADGLGEGTTTFTLDQAKQAGYLGKGGNWASDPESMLVARATSRCAKRVIPDLLMGLTMTEEMDDVVAVEGSPVEALQATTEAVAAIEAPTPAPEPAKQASKLPTYHTGGEVLGPKGQEVPIMALAGERAPQAAAEPEDAELVPDEPETAEQPTQATLDTADDNSDPLSADEWKQLLRERGLTLGDVAPAAKDILGLQSVNYSLLGKLEGASCARLLEALPAGNGEAFA